MSRRIRLGESLIEAGLINNAQLEEALARKTTTGERIGEALVALGYITDRDLVRTLAKDANIPFLEADELHVDSTVVPLLTTAIACDNNLVPLRADGRALVVAMSNPFDIAVIRLLERESGRQIRTVTGDPGAIAALVARHYGPVPGRISGVRNVPASPDGRPAWSRLSAPATDAVTTTMPATGADAARSDAPALLASADAARPAAGRGPRLDLALPLTPTRLFAATIDQDGVSLLEYVEETAGFRILDQRSRNGRLPTIESAADAIVDLLRETDARKVRVSLVLQQFGAVFQRSMLPSGTDHELTEAVRADVQRSLGAAEARIAIARARNDGSASRTESWDSEPVFVAAAATAIIDRLLDRLARARVNVECLTVVPEIFRQLYRALDGSTEATAMLVCLHNGPHVAFFVDGRLELAIEPPPALAGDGPLQPAVILAQLERGATFLRQQAKGTVATRLLLVAPAGDHDALESAIEARTGMRVIPLGQAIGSPEAVVAMGAVLAARSEDRLDLSRRAIRPVPRSAPVATRPSLMTRMLIAAAVVAAAWCGTELVSMASAQREVERLEAQVASENGSIQTMAQTARARALMSAVRAATRSIDADRASAAALLSGIANADSPATRIDSLSIAREGADFRSTLFARATSAAGLAANRAADELVGRLRANAAFSAVTMVDNTGSVSLASSEPMRFSVTFLAPGGPK
jgi:hypothetical protein